MLAFAAVMAMSACGPAQDSSLPGSAPSVAIAVSPQIASVVEGSTLQLTATISTATSSAVTWSVTEAAGGTVDAAGLYTAPLSAGTFHAVATSVADPSQSAIATVSVTPAPTSSGTTPPPPAGVVPAFPGAQGGGALSKGGRGGTVYLVTNLNDSGSGSLRACVEASGARTCVFRVGGQIVLQSSMNVTSPYLTVAGQTAPGGIALVVKNGVTPANTRVFNVSTHDVTIRYIRAWGDCISGDTPNPQGGGSYGISIFWGGTSSYNIIVDHSSLLWMTGKSWQLWDASGNSTLSWTILGENVNCLGGNGQSTPAGSGNDGAILANGAVNTDFHHNLFTSGDLRNPMLTSKSARLVNNAVHNWGSFASMFDTFGNIDFVGNHFKPGHLNGPSGGMRELMLSSVTTPSNFSLYLANNRSDWTGPTFAPDNGTRGVVTGNEADGGWSKLVGGSARYGGYMSATDGLTPLPQSFNRGHSLDAAGASTAIALPITADPVSNLTTLLSGAGGAGASQRLDCNGNWVASRDSADTRIISGFVNGTGLSGVPASRLDANGGVAPTLPTGTACADTDGDGIPDAYEIAKCGSATCLDAQTVQPDGYTNLEHYLNGQ